MSKDEEKKRKRGNQPFEPTKLQRITVAALAREGLTLTAISKVIFQEIKVENKDGEIEIKYQNISTRTLTRHFAKELTENLTAANAQVQHFLYVNCSKGHFGAQKFWLEAKAGWRTDGIPEDEEPIPRTVVVGVKDAS